MPQPQHPCPQCGDSQWQLVDAGWQCRKCLTTLAAGETAILPPHLAGKAVASPPATTNQNAGPSSPPPQATVVPPHLAKPQSPQNANSGQPAATSVPGATGAPMAKVIPPHLNNQSPTAPPTAAKPSHVPPHLQPAQPVENKAAVATPGNPVKPVGASQPASTSKAKSRKSSLFAWVVVGGGTLGGIAVLIGGIFLTLYAIEFNQQTASTPPSKRQSSSQSHGKDTWQDSAGHSLPVYRAPDQRIRIRGVEVGVAYLETGPMLVKDDNNRVTESGPKDLLHVFLMLQNETGQPQTYQSWWSGEFKIDDETQRATLTDNRGNKYKQHPTPASGGIRGQFRGNEVPPHERREDVIVFEAGNINDVDYFELTLPSAALGGRGLHRFRIPADMLSSGSGSFGSVMPKPDNENMEAMNDNSSDSMDEADE